jgi:hypothetical protein
MARQLVWWKELESEKLHWSVAHALLNDKHAALRLLREFTPTLTISNDDGKPKLIKANFEDEQYILLDRIIGADLIYFNLL